MSEHLNLESFEINLLQQKYSHYYIDHVINSCRKFQVFRDTKYPNKNLEDCLALYFKEVFNKDIYNLECDLSQSQSVAYRFIRRFIDFTRDGVFKLRYLRMEKPHFDEDFKEELSDFKRWLTCNYSNRTTKVYYKYFEKFCIIFYSDGLRDITKIKPELIIEVLKDLKNYKARSVELILGSFKAFYKYLYEKKGICVNYDLLSSFNTSRYSPIPSRWAPEDIEKLFSVINTDSKLGKRNWAMLKLAYVYGIRACDIRNLKFNNINWKEHKITFEQCKTGNTLTLPLFKEIGWALIDYIKNGRPDSESEYIFLRHKPPYDPFRDGQTFWYLINLYIKKANLDINHKKGFHSLRSTLATDMIAANSEIPIVSDVLGHKSINSTKVYIRSDIDNIRDCCLDVSQFIGESHGQ